MSRKVTLVVFAFVTLLAFQPILPPSMKLERARAQTVTNPALQSLAAQLASAPDNDTRLAIVEQFFDDVNYNRTGMPLKSGDTYTFLYLQEWGVNEPLRVSGGFNSWSTTGEIMSRVIPNFWLWYAEVNIPEGSTRIPYKFVGVENSVNKWFADIHAKAYGYDDNGEYSLVRPGQGSSLERVLDFNSSQLNNTRTLRIYLPPNYSNTTKYPVLYMHDGQNLYDPSGAYGSWRVNDVADSLLSSSAIAPCIIVGIDNMGSERLDEYGHVQDYISEFGGWCGGKAPQYAEFIEDTVKPYIDNHYSTNPHRLATSTMGSSMGGLVSMYLAWAHNDTFGSAACLSSTFDWGKIGANNPTMIENVQCNISDDLVLYVDSGGNAASGDDNYNDALNMCDALQEHGYTFVNVTANPSYANTAKDNKTVYYYWAPNAEHNEAAWNARVDVPLKLLFNPTRYAVVLSSIAQGNSGTNDTCNQTPNAPPSAHASGPSSAYAGEQICFSANASSDPDSDEITCNWDFDSSDGITNESAGRYVYHAFDTVGNFTITMRVFDEHGASNSTTLAIAVSIKTDNTNGTNNNGTNTNGTNTNGNNNNTNSNNNGTNNNNTNNTNNTNNNNSKPVNDANTKIAVALVCIMVVLACVGTVFFIVYRKPAPKPTRDDANDNPKEGTKCDRKKDNEE